MSRYNTHNRVEIIQLQNMRKNIQNPIKDIF